MIISKTRCYDGSCELLRNVISFCISIETKLGDERGGDVRVLLQTDFVNTVPPSNQLMKVFTGKNKHLARTY